LFVATDASMPAELYWQLRIVQQDSARMDRLRQIALHDDREPEKAGRSAGEVQVGLQLWEPAEVEEGQQLEGKCLPLADDLDVRQWRAPIVPIRVRVARPGSPARVLQADLLVGIILDEEAA